MPNTLNQSCFQPGLHFLPNHIISQLHDQAVQLLAQIGIWIDDSATRQQLLEAGASAAPNDPAKILFPPSLVASCLKTVPSVVQLYDQAGQCTLELAGAQSYFVPGSSALNVLDWESQRPRRAQTPDLVDYYRLMAQLPDFPAQSTAMVAADVAPEIADAYRLYLALLFSPKPVVTGLFRFESFATMLALLLSIRGNASALKHQPLAIFDCCPLSPLRWESVACQTMVACARVGIPVELVPMPLPGATAPIQLQYALVQYLAEILSGLVIVQTAQPGAPVIAGGAPAIFEMRGGTPATGASNATLLALGYVQLAKSLQVPTHAFLGLSDAKLIDAQAGFETGIGATMAVLSEINLIAGAGMLSCINCFSPEKLIIDHDLAGLALQFKKGMAFTAPPELTVFKGTIQAGDYFLTAPETLHWLRHEMSPLPQVIDWQSADYFDSLSIAERAHRYKKELLKKDFYIKLNVDACAALYKIMLSAAQNVGMSDLPTLHPAVGLSK